jgi:aerobic-type carbon monoxide dehydrogenase small subunit (CoxS/CutS family)
MSDQHLITLSVNGNEHEVLVEARRTLVDALRHDLGLTGTHVGCEHGICGACTVLLDGQPVRACLMFAVQGENHEIRTVESLSNGEELSDLQQQFSAHHGLQCGFCTPGFLMLGEAVLTQNPEASREEIRDAVSSNLCRCTGYQTIVDSVEACGKARCVQKAGRGADGVSAGQPCDPSTRSFSKKRDSN